jgi:maltose alpha-D-glucosyltransferase/alpha-amylase
VLEGGGKTSALAVLHRFVENQGDAWTVTANALDRFVEEQRLLTAEAAGQSDEQTAYLSRIQLVGTRVAQLQLALASRDDIPEFAPEPVSAGDVAHWREEALQSANAVLDRLAARRADLPDNVRALLDEVTAERKSLPKLLRDLLPDSIELSKIRHHGDFHLGQVLMVKDDVSIIDFEGEPRRSMEERRLKAPAARDVAGLIRSIDYSATAALRRALNSAPDPQERIARALDRWRDAAVGAFLGSYRQTLADARLWPAAHEQADRLLDFFLLQKVFYEIGYELAHRPDWVWVPLAGARRILRSERAAQ